MDYADRKLCTHLMTTDSVICRDAAKRIQGLCAELADLRRQLAEKDAEIARLKKSVKDAICDLELERFDDTHTTLSELLETKE